MSLPKDSCFRDIRNSIKSGVERMKNHRVQINFFFYLGIAMIIIGIAMLLLSTPG